MAIGDRSQGCDERRTGVDRNAAVCVYTYIILDVFQPWLRALKNQQPLMASIQPTADSMQGCERLMIDGMAQFLFCHSHPAASNHLSSGRFRSVCWVRTYCASGGAIACQRQCGAGAYSTSFGMFVLQIETCRRVGIFKDRVPYSEVMAKKTLTERRCRIGAKSSDVNKTIDSPPSTDMHCEGRATLSRLSPKDHPVSAGATAQIINYFFVRRDQRAASAAFNGYLEPLSYPEQ